MRAFYRAGFGIVSLLAAGIWGCGGSSGGGTTQNPTLHVDKVSGDSQVANAGSPLGAALVVVVKDDKGNPVSGETVNWSAATGGGSVTPGGATGADGQASATRTLGPNAGIQTTQAAVGSSKFTFINISHIQGATTISASGGGGLSDSVLSAVPPYFVLVTDEHNNPVQNVTVNWAVTVGAGLLSGSTSQTNASGIAQITHTLSSTTGMQSVQASVAGLAGSPITFSTNATAGNPASIELSSGNHQVGPVSTALPNPHVVLVKDAHGNPASGISVSWKIGVGGGNLSTTSPTTLVNGTASVTRTLGASAGANSDTATLGVVSGSPIAFTDTGATVTTITVGPGGTLTFSPNAPTVSAGSFVKFTWASGTHNVTWASGPNDPGASGDKSSGTFTVRLTALGTYGYYCSIHGTPTTGMHNSIIAN